jgi:hypothetical protein
MAITSSTDANPARRASSALMSVVVIGVTSRMSSMPMAVRNVPPLRTVGRICRRKSVSTSPAAMRCSTAFLISTRASVRESITEKMT